VSFHGGWAEVLEAFAAHIHAEAKRDYREEQDMSATQSETAGKVVWFELPAKDTGRATSFYGELFGWQFQRFEGGAEYNMTYEGGGAIHPAESQNGHLLYFGSDDIDASVARVRERGGQAADKQEIPGVGLYSQCTDTEGNPFGLYQQGGS
jgi:predicted enzyme related to lactoylglutathione lyase